MTNRELTEDRLTGHEPTDREITDHELTDRELMEQFERATLPPQCFRHREHVRVAFLYLTDRPVLEALQAFSSGLRRFAAAHGKSKLYHETITWAYIFLIRERLARAGRAMSWEEFAADNADLLTWKDGVLTRFYREETLKSDLAREIFVFPDKYVESESCRIRVLDTGGLLP